MTKRSRTWLRVRLGGIRIDGIGSVIHFKMSPIRVAPRARFQLRHLAPTMQTVAATNALLMAGAIGGLGSASRCAGALVGGLLVGAKSLKPPTLATVCGAYIGILQATYTGNMLALVMLAPLAIVGSARDIRAYAVGRDRDGADRGDGERAGPDRLDMTG